MAIERVFLGWDGPCLHRVVEWLGDRYTGEACDLSGVVLVTPGARAGRRLEELLAETLADRALTPPKIVTVGKLPELLYEPARPIASGAQSLLARLQALKSADADVLTRVVPHRPATDDLAGWLALAQDLGPLHETLAADALGFDQALARLDELPDFIDHERWQALGRLQDAYERLLDDAGLIDRQAARRDALAAHRCTSDRHVVLVAATDLNRVTRLMLDQLAGNVTALIHAPKSEADAFDELGCLIVDRWHDRPVALDPQHVRVVDRPRDQTYEVVRLIAQPPTQLARRYAADQITVGLGDEAMSPMIERTLELAGAAARPAVGKPIAQSPPAMLLSAAAAFLSGRRLSDFAALMRHPDVEEFVARQVSPADDGKRAARQWLTLLDRYATDHLQSRLTGQWLGDADERTKLKAVYDAVGSALPGDAERAQPIGQWCVPIAETLRAFYATRSLNRHDADDRRLVEAMEAIAEVLRQLASVEAGSPLSTRLAAADAVTVALTLIGEQATPPEGGPPAVELIGWLELQLDDAPALIVTGVNEHAIPQSMNADAFLPDHVRRHLGLTDNRRRYARDLYALTAILQSRPDVTLIAGRRDADNNPLTPSRLLLACDNDELPTRVLRFYGDQTDAHAAPAPLLLTPGPRSRFLVPPPTPPDKPLDRLRVTAFRDYLACPYRFYLKHVRGIEGIDDAAVEMGGDTFGGLAHDVLKVFGQSDLAHATNADDIAKALSQTLDQLARVRFGPQPPVAVVIQIEQLRYRLDAFAHWQAQHANEGWRIVREHVEVKAAATITVDNEPFTITGRIDRIDRHGSDGRYLLLDYKSGDAPRKPDDTHRTGPRNAKTWTDLQLPLYRTLAEGLNVTGGVGLGYVQLPKDAAHVGLAEAQWTPDELNDALDEAKRIVRAIRAGVFWPPADPPGYADDLEGICMDTCLGRREAIEAVGRAMASPTTGGSR